jgi:hypothetical protein
MYQERLRVPEYFWFDPFSGEWAGFALRNGGYEAIAEDSHGYLVSRRLGLALIRWEGIYQEVEARWLRWATLTGALLPTPQEAMSEAQRQAAEAEHRAAEAERRAAEAQDQAATLQALLARYRERFGDAPE